MIDKEMEGNEEDINYLINDELHKCISAAKDTPNKSYNSEVELVSELTHILTDYYDLFKNLN